MTIGTWFGSLGFHSVLAMIVSPLLGFLPELMIEKHGSAYGAYSPAIAVVALLLGYRFEPRFGRAAFLVWVVGAVWFALGFYDAMRGWDVSWSAAPNRYAHAVDSLLGPTSRCSGSECLGEFLFTTPFVASITYSIGAFVRKVRTGV